MNLVREYPLPRRGLGHQHLGSTITTNPAERRTAPRKGGTRRAAGLLLALGAVAVLLSVSTFVSPAAASHDDVLEPGFQLSADGTINSDNGNYFLKMQGDGKLVLYRARDLTPVWWLNMWDRTKSFHQGDRAVMQRDGNFVVYGAGGAVWASHTNVRGSFLKVQDDGKLVIYGPDLTPIKQSCRVDIRIGDRAEFFTLCPIR